MAAAMVGGAFLGAFFNVVLDKLASPEVVNFIRGKKLGPLLQRLETTLKVVRAVLNDAEKKQITDSHVKDWLNELKHVVYMADDLLDELATKAATTHQKEVTTSNLFSRFFNAQDRELAGRLTEIVDRLEHILKLKESLDLKEIATDNLSYRVPSTSVQDGHVVYGRDDDKEAIIKLLLQDNNEAEQVSVIPVVGMGGVGKTTLAQMVYNHYNLKQNFNFDFKAWVCVSEAFDIIKVTKTLIEALTQQPCQINDFNSLQESLVKKLKGKKFFIILDDVWIEDYDNWNLLKKPFQYGKRGSKILITTRSENVASVVQTVQTYHLSQLSNEDCWSVFANHACLSLGAGENITTLEEIGMEIVKKCKGLPLAAQSLGGLLRRKRDIKDWNNVLNSDIWELSKSESKIIPSLRISYHYLPSYLKRCFVYCSLYPKDFEFEKNDVILLWMAEDLLPTPKKGKTLEEVGDECFDYLVSSSFLQRSSTQWKKELGYFVMHDLMHDLATFLGGDFYFRSYNLGQETTIGSITRHLSFINFSSPSFENYRVLGRAKFLRTLLTTVHEWSPFRIEEVLCTELSNLEYLRVLSFRYFQKLVSLHDSIGGLIHLRYLNLSSTGIESLSETVCNLYNLQTLKLEGCENLTMLPSGTQNLVNLHYLGIWGTPIQGMPKGMSKLKQLQHLSYFIVGKHEEIKIKELGGLSNLQGRFSIKELENVNHGNEALEARMMDKKHIQHLELSWSSDEDCMDSQTEMDILCKLEPHQDLKFLQIIGYRGTRYPDWVRKPCFPNMTRITLCDCKNCFTLPSLGQLPSLIDLNISNWETLVSVDESFFSNNDNNDIGSLLTVPFPSLKSLVFVKMPSWEVWSCFEQPGAFPQLKCLIIEDCPKLKGDLPSHLPTLEQLVIRKCEQLAGSLTSFPLDSFPILKTLDISDCENLDSLVVPPSLTEISLSNCCEKLVSGLAWPSMDMLTLVRIRGPCDWIKSFPKQGLLLPPSLKNLFLFGLSSLETLDCKGLLHLTSLDYLLIDDCPKLENMAGERLPPSPTHFYIYNCPLLGEQCRMKHPQIWPKISHIHNIQVDYEVIS